MIYLLLFYLSSLTNWWFRFYYCLLPFCILSHNNGGSTHKANSMLTAVLSALTSRVPSCSGLVSAPAHREHPQCWCLLPSGVLVLQPRTCRTPWLPWSPGSYSIRFWRGKEHPWMVCPELESALFYKWESLAQAFWVDISIPIFEVAELRHRTIPWMKVPQLIMYKPPGWPSTYCDVSNSHGDELFYHDTFLERWAYNHFLVSLEKRGLFPCIKFRVHFFWILKGFESLMINV